MKFPHLGLITVHSIQLFHYGLTRQNPYSCRYNDQKWTKYWSHKVNAITLSNVLSLLVTSPTSCQAQHFHLLPLNPHQPQNSDLLVSICNCSQWNAIWCFLSWFQFLSPGLRLLHWHHTCFGQQTTPVLLLLAFNGSPHRFLIEKLQCLVELNFCGLGFPTSPAEELNLWSQKGFFFSCFVWNQKHLQKSLKKHCCSVSWGDAVHSFLVYIWCKSRPLFIVTSGWLVGLNPKNLCGSDRKLPQPTVAR